MCKSDTPMQEALKIIDGLAKGVEGRANAFLIIVDNNRRVIGTLTDSDFRRGIIAGIAIHDSVEKFAFKSPTIGMLGDNQKNLALLMGLSPHAAFLPVVNQSKEIAELLFLSIRNSQECSVLIMAGGFGRRLGEKTKSKPKPMLSIAGKPILEHIISRVEQINPDSIYISTHYLAEQIHKFCEQLPVAHKIKFLNEASPLGTAGAIGLLPNPIKHPLVITNGDVLTDLDFIGFRDFYFQNNFDIVIAVVKHNVSIPFGVVSYTEQGGFIGITEKPIISNYVSAGIYIVSASVRSLVQFNQVIDMPQLIEVAKSVGLSIGIFPLHEYWADIGRPEDLLIPGSNFKFLSSGSNKYSEFSNHD